MYVVKSELRGEYVITKPASTDAYDSTVAAVAGTAAGGFDKCFPPTPNATRYTIKVGIHATRSYLIRFLCYSPHETEVSKAQSHQFSTLYPQNDT